MIREFQEKDISRILELIVKFELTPRGKMALESGVDYKRSLFLCLSGVDPFNASTFLVDDKVTKFSFVSYAKDPGSQGFIGCLDRYTPDNRDEELLPASEEWLKARGVSLVRGVCRCKGKSHDHDGYKIVAYIVEKELV